MHLQRVLWCYDHLLTKSKVCKIMWVLHLSSSCKIMVCKRKHVLHLPLIIDNNGFLNKKVVVVMKACARQQGMKLTWNKLLVKFVAIARWLWNYLCKKCRWNGATWESSPQTLNPSMQDHDEKNYKTTNKKGECKMINIIRNE
jgi:hypothetical protein